MDGDVKLELKNLEDLAQYAVEKARSLGAEAAKSRIDKAAGLSVSCRNADMENVSFTNGRTMRITVYRNDARGSVSTSDLSHAAIDESIRAALSIAGHTDSDPDARLPPPELLAFEPVDFDVFHPMDADPGEMFERCRILEERAKKAHKAVISVDSAEENATTRLSAMATSQGLTAGTASTTYTRSLAVMCEKDGDRKTGVSYTYAPKFGDLWRDESLVDEAVSDGVSQLCPAKLSTGDYPVIFDARMSQFLAYMLFSALDGHIQYYKAGFLTDCLNRRVMPAWMNVREDPHVRGSLSSCYLDDDGVKTSPMTIIENGEARNYFLNNYFANKLKMKNNGHNRGVSTTFFTDSRGPLRTKEELIREMDRGIIVHGTMGSNMNIINGDLSMGASGFYVENGEIRHPVAEFTVAGNFKDIFAGIVATAGDHDPRQVADLGSVLVDRLKIAGI